jgi:thiamine biosynthesis lipoprotein
MGTTFNIVLYSPDSALARRAADAAFTRIDSLNQRLSDYLVDSELNRLSATAGTGQAVAISEDLWNVLSEAQQISERTEGAFDVTVGALTKLWRWGIRRNTLPPDDELQAARNVVGYRGLILNDAAETALLRAPGMRLDLGGIAKGYATDEALDVLRSYGLSRALVDGGGDITIGDSPTDSTGWRIALTSVSSNREIESEYWSCSNTAIATSGATYRYVESDGVRYSHIVDPRTGMGVTAERLVTVLAPTGMRADALASAFSVLGEDAWEESAFGEEGTAVRFITRESAGYRQWQSAEFEASQCSY